MKEIIAIIRPGRWSATKKKLVELSLPYTHCRVYGRGRQKGLRYLSVSNDDSTAEAGIRYFPKQCVILMVPDERVEEVVQMIMTVNRTGMIGDGKIFVSPLESAVRIRTNEAGLLAVA